MQATPTIGMSHLTLDNWLRADKLGKVSAASIKVAAPDKMEAVRLGTKNVQLKIKRDVILKKVAHFARESL